MEREPGFREGPAVEVLTQTGETISLTWDNAVIYTYKEPVYNHVKYMDDGGNWMGFVTPQSVMDALFERDYPHFFSPVTSDETREWYTALVATGADEELDELLNDAA